MPQLATQTPLRQIKTEAGRLPSESSLHGHRHVFTIAQQAWLTIGRLSKKIIVPCGYNPDPVDKEPDPNTGIADFFVTVGQGKGFFTMSKFTIVLALILASAFAGADTGVAGHDREAAPVASSGKATDIVDFFSSEAEYHSKEWWPYFPIFNVYVIRENLDDEQQYRLIYSFLDDTAALVKPHMDEECEQYYFGVKDNSDEEKLSRSFAMYAGIFSLDPELGHAWMMYLLKRSFWERVWGGNKLWKAFRKSCMNKGVTVKDALTSVSAGRKHAYEAGK